MYDVTQISKKLSYVLRHNPDSIGIKLDPQGWTDVYDLIQKMNISLAQLQLVVSNNNKKRFTFSPDGTKIRAAQGHSLKNVDLGYQPVPVDKVPLLLYHGTPLNFANKILSSIGIQKMNRTHVHLSGDVQTAKKVAERRTDEGIPVILVINSAKMAEEGIKFFLADNGVWLTEFVDGKYIIEVRA